MPSHGAGVTRRLSPRSPVWIMLTCNAGVMLTPQLTASVDPLTCWLLNNQRPPWSPSTLRGCGWWRWPPLCEGSASASYSVTRARPPPALTWSCAPCATPSSTPRCMTLSSSTRWVLYIMLAYWMWDIYNVHQLPI